MDINFDDYDTQKYLLEIVLSNPDVFSRIQNIFIPQHFHNTLKPAAKYVDDYVKKYNSLPTYKQIKLATGMIFEEPDISNLKNDWILDTFEQFAQKQALIQAVLKSIDYIEKNNTGPVEQIIKNAVQLGLPRDMGIDYFNNPKERLLAIKENNGQTSTGWSDLDKALYGGFNRGELQIFAGLPGSGKSLFLQNLAINWINAGLNGIFITLELSQELTSMRIDSMITRIPSYNIFKQIDDVDLKVRMAAKINGKLQIKYLPSQSTVNDIRAYIRELKIKKNFKIDFLCVDYVDLLMPASVKVSPGDLFIRDKYICEELRNLAGELKILLATASQFNRSGTDEIEFDFSHIAGGMSKINTGDNVFGIFTTRAMRDHGKYQLQLMKTRNSAGVGQKIDLAFNTGTLRITNISDEENEKSSSNKTSKTLSEIKRKSKITTPVNSNSNKQTEVGNILKQKLDNMTK